MTPELAAIVITALLCGTALAGLYIFLTFKELARKAQDTSLPQRKVEEIENRVIKLEMAKAFTR